MKTIGRFQILAPLGKGAMGMVCRALDPSLEREVALKVVSPELISDPESLVRFQREARAAARLQHPNIVTIYELGQDKGVHYIAMELLPGADLAQEMAPGRHRLEDKLKLMVDVCRALHHAHQHGIVHRDVKPANIRVLPDGVVKLVDFGIAHLAGSQLTAAGIVLGTPTYLAPEVLSGARVDHLSDMWAVGVILYEIAAGRAPFDAPTFSSIARRIVSDPLPPLRQDGLPPGLPAVIARALAKLPENRFRDMEELAEALHGVVFRSRRVAVPVSDVTRQRAFQRNVDDARTYVARGDLNRALQVARKAAAHEATPGEAAALVEDIGSRLAAAPPAPPPAAAPAAPRAPRRPTAATLLREKGAEAYRETALFGEPPPVHAAARSTTGDLLAAAGADGSVRIWDLRLHPRRAVATLRADRRAGQEARILAVAFSPDARVLAAIHLDGALRLWDLPSGAELPARLKHDAASCLAFSPSGRTLATGGMDSTLKLWEVEGARAGEARRELHRQPLSVTAVTYAGGILATGHAQGLIRVNDAQSLRLMATVRGPRALVSLLASSPEGRRLVIGGQDRTLRLVDLGSGGTLWTAAPHRRPTVAVAFLPCGSALATASLEHAVHVLDVTSGIALGSLWCRPEEAVVGISASPGGSLAATLGDGRVRVWSPAHSLPQS